MSILAPGRDHISNATAITSVVLSEPALFKGDPDKLRTAAFITAVAFRESSFHEGAKSKTGDYGLMQINQRPDLLNDAESSVRVAFRMLRESFYMCPAYPLAFYASGPGACENERAQKISRDRMLLANHILHEARVDVAPSAP